VIPPPRGSSQRATNPPVSEHALTRKVISVMRLMCQRHGTNASHVIGGGAGCRVSLVGLPGLRAISKEPDASSSACEGLAIQTTDLSRAQTHSFKSLRKGALAKPMGKLSGVDLGFPKATMCGQRTR
jgi:hypothetical protein